MRKIYSLLTAVLAMFAINAHADRILYSENYEVGGVPTTWTSNANPDKGGNLVIAGDTEGHYISFLIGSDNGRSAHCLWGESIFDDVKSGMTEYSVHVEFQFQAFGNNQYNGEFAIFSDATCAMTNGSLGGSGKDWAPYSSRANCLFGINQNSATAASATDTDHSHWFINNDTTNAITPTAGTWYELTLTVNTGTREVSYTLADFDGTFSKTGSKTLSAEENIYANGLYIMNARYQSITNVDNIKITVPGDYANEPVIALTGLNMKERSYTISFMEGETLHLTLTDGTEKTVGYYDGEVPGQYIVTTTTSGTLKAYTTVGSQTSQTVEVEVNCVEITLPQPTTTIVSASEGYAKSYKLYIDNKTIEMQPEIFYDVVFKPADGSEGFATNNINNGSIVELPTKGTLTITTKAQGYTASNLILENNVEYTVIHDFDFEHMTGEDIAARGFTESASNVSDQWNTRGRLWYKYIKGTEVGDTTTVYPYGATLETNTFKEYEMLGSTVDEEKAHSIFAPMYFWFDTVNIHMKTGVGVISPGKKGDDGSGSWVQNATLGVDGLTDDDFIVVCKIGSYGTSVNPTYKLEDGYTEESAAEAYNKLHKYTITEVYPGTKTFPLYRIDTSLARVFILRDKTKPSGIETINYNKVVSDHNAPIYNLNGVQVNPNALQKGIYVKQGKKFIVR